MEGHYVTPVKQELYKDWKRYAQTNLFPHTQTCPHCFMVITTKKLTDLENYHNRNLWATWPPGWPAEKIRQHPKELRILCMGCDRFIRFTGTDHLPKRVQYDILKKVEKELHHFDGTLRADNSVERFLVTGMILMVFIVLMMVI